MGVATAPKEALWLNPSKHHNGMTPMKDDDDDRPKKKITHEIGQDLALLSVKELQERIALLREEIARLEASIASKQASRSVADQFFKK